MISRRHWLCLVMPPHTEWRLSWPQVMEDGSEWPVPFASRSLSSAKKKYAQVEKEGLAIVFGVKKFHDYLLVQNFTIRSDHKPLQYLFSRACPVPPMVSARIQRWALTLSIYNYTIRFIPGNQNAHADDLSQMPLPESVASVPTPPEVILMKEMLQGLQ